MVGDGDPLTPLYPAKNWTYRSRSVEEALRERILVSIPVLPMSYGDVQNLLSKMGGRQVPAAWQGGLNFTYRLGPGFKDRGEKVRLDVRSSLERRLIRNVLGYITGTQVPSS